MGNRAIIIFENEGSNEFSPAIYLHWNGGPDSVYQFLDEMDYRKIRGSGDLAYQSARFVQICGEFLDGDSYSSTSLGMWNGPESLGDLQKPDFNHGDNGIYLVFRKGATRRVRRFFDSPEFKEWDSEQVENERERAYKSDYFKDGGFRATFAEMHNNKKPSKY